MARSTSSETAAETLDPRPLLDRVHPADESAVLPDPLQTLIARAVDTRATDIHVDVWQNRAAVRFRIDGVIHEHHTEAALDAERLINQVKIAAELGPDAIVAPSEGQFHWDRGDVARDVRATLVPTAPHNESAHLRLLQTHGKLRGVGDIGLEDEQKVTIERTLDNASGLVLIGGPTGSGKTTTLYALARHLDADGRIAASIEDPAEFDLPSVRQLQVDHRHNLTMHDGLRTLLRMDPDLLLVGEVRDEESALIAAQAALAGRLMMATVHGRDAAAAIDTLRYLHVPRYVLSGALSLVIAQDLVRLLCEHCKQGRDPRPHEAEVFREAETEVPDQVYDPQGCPECQEIGFHGRAGVFEIVPIDADLEQTLLDEPSQLELRQVLRKRGIHTVATAALHRAARGETSVSEASRLLLRGRHAVDHH